MFLLEQIIFFKTHLLFVHFFILNLLEIKAEKTDIFLDSWSFF